MRALLVVARARVGRRAVEHHDRLAARVAELVEQRLRLDLAHAHVVEGHVVVDRRARDQAVIRDHRDVRLLGAVDRRGRRLGVHGVEHEHLRAVGDRRLGLLLLTRGVLIGVLVDDLAARAQRLDLGLEARLVLLLVARGLGLRQQQGDRAALVAAGGLGTAAAAASSSRRRRRRKRPLRR